MGQWRRGGRRTLRGRQWRCTAAVALRGGPLPRFGPAYFAQAKLFARAGDNAAAAAAARTALELAPGVDEQKPLHAFLSRIYHLMGDEAAAREHEQWINSR